MQLLELPLDVCRTERVEEEGTLEAAGVDQVRALRVDHVANGHAGKVLRLHLHRDAVVSPDPREVAMRARAPPPARRQSPGAGVGSEVRTGVRPRVDAYRNDGGRIRPEVADDLAERCGLERAEIPADRFDERHDRRFASQRTD